MTVVDTASLGRSRRVIKIKQGLGPMGFNADGRFGIVLNPGKPGGRDRRRHRLAGS